MTAIRPDITAPRIAYGPSALRPGVPEAEGREATTVLISSPRDPHDVGLLPLPGYNPRGVRVQNLLEDAQALSRRMDLDYEFVCDNLVAIYLTSSPENRPSVLEALAWRSIYEMGEDRTVNERVLALLDLTLGDMEGVTREEVSAAFQAAAANISTSGDGALQTKLVLFSFLLNEGLRRNPLVLFASQLNIIVQHAIAEFEDLCKPVIGTYLDYIEVLENGDQDPLEKAGDFADELRKARRAIAGDFVGLLAVSGKLTESAMLQELMGAEDYDRLIALAQEYDSREDREYSIAALAGRFMASLRLLEKAVMQSIKGETNIDELKQKAAAVREDQTDWRQQLARCMAFRMNMLRQLGLLELSDAYREAVQTLLGEEEAQRATFSHPPQVQLSLMSEAAYTGINLGAAGVDMRMLERVIGVLEGFVDNGELAWGMGSRATVLTTSGKGEKEMFSCIGFVWHVANLLLTNQAAWTGNTGVVSFAGKFGTDLPQEFTTLDRQPLFLPGESFDVYGGAEGWRQGIATLRNYQPERAVAIFVAQSYTNVFTPEGEIARDEAGRVEKGEPAHTFLIVRIGRGNSGQALFVLESSPKLKGTVGYVHRVPLDENAPFYDDWVTTVAPITPTADNVLNPQNVQAVNRPKQTAAR